MRRLVLSFIAALLGLTLLIPAAPANAALPNVPSTEEAQTQLAGLAVAPKGPMTGYSRRQFPTWAGVSGNCNAREMVLIRDGENVETNRAFNSIAGTWYSAYDGVTITNSSAVDVDHMVPLAEAWRTGAADWTPQERREFANDLTRPQLLAVSASSNRSKGDQTPAQWLPPETSFRCEYSKAWIAVKSYWKLTIDSAEKQALGLPRVWLTSDL
ncbi:HNH endonuclease family protein [Acaricomes phytoseiuli]|uniref:HNH endonuclease family protein n=1 Tax=Acaricomes phytoseiuli TaxID=291968 RepID=UPI0022221316|nr:HNH endonuclease family protein [Acaricomes phytoseiuli]MCW1250200.1 HNH endonuclease family protein [Acaricomes phytoseiuli]